MPHVTPEKLRPYLFHGIDLVYGFDDKEAVGECPFCGREEKFCVAIDTGLWNCVRCKEGGNATTFLQKLWAESDKSTTDYSEYAAERRLLYPETLMSWEVVSSIMNHDVLIPGYTAKKKMTQLYKYVDTAKGKRLLPTPTIGHKLHGVNLYDKDKPIVYLCEGPWDAMALWEILNHTKVDDGGNFLPTANKKASLGAGASVLAVPGAMVFERAWLPLFAGKTVNLMYDNDHARPNPKTGKEVPPAGNEGMMRVQLMLSHAGKPPVEIKCLLWGGTGSTTDLPHGYDVRDHLS